MGKLFVVLVVLIAACAPQPQRVDEAELWYERETDGYEVFCPRAFESVVQSSMDPDDTVIIARCAWHCATYEPHGLTSPGTLLLVLYDAAEAEWQPEVPTIMSFQDEHCD